MQKPIDRHIWRIYAWVIVVLVLLWGERLIVRDHACRVAGFAGLGWDFEYGYYCRAKRLPPPKPPGSAH